MERFDIAMGDRDAPTVNGNEKAKSSSSESSAKPESSISDDEPDEPIESRPRKKQKTVSKRESDAAMAARLQAEENGMARPTRGGASRKKGTAVKKSPKKKKKSATKVNSDDDSVEGSDGEKKANKRGGPFNA